MRFDVGSPARRASREGVAPLRSAIRRRPRGRRAPAVTRRGAAAVGMERTIPRSFRSAMEESKRTESEPDRTKPEESNRIESDRTCCCVCDGGRTGAARARPHSHLIFSARSASLWPTSFEWYSRRPCDQYCSGRVRRDARVAISGGSDGDGDGDGDGDDTTTRRRSRAARDQRAVALVPTAQLACCASARRPIDRSRSIDRPTDVFSRAASSPPLLLSPSRPLLLVSARAVASERGRRQTPGGVLSWRGASRDLSGASIDRSRHGVVWRRRR